MGGRGRDQPGARLRDRRGRPRRRPRRLARCRRGPHRLRVSARGRTESAEREQTFADDDADADADDEDEPLEHYLLELWSAPPEPPVVVCEVSRFALDTLDPPVTQWPAEREPGLVAARAVAADLRAAPGARALRGGLVDVRVSVEISDTPTRLFNRVRHANGWPPSNGGVLGSNESVGDQASHYADPPDPDGLAPLLGVIETEVVEIAKPRRLVKSWNWRVAGPDGAPNRTRPPLLEHDSTVTMTFATINSAGQDPRTLVAIHHAGVPAEWVTDLDALWRWDIANASRR